MTSAIPPMSIVHVVAPALFGGVETVVVALASGLKEAGDDVSVAAMLSASSPHPHPVCEALEQRGVDVVPTVIAARRYGEERQVVHSIMKDRGAQLLHTHGYRPDVVDGSVARRLGVPRVTTAHGFTGGGLRNQVYEWAQKRAARRADAVIAVSGELKRELVCSGAAEGRVHTLQNAWEPTTTLLSRIDARQILGLPGEAFVVGWVGRLTAEKGPDVFVRAAAAVSEGGALFSVVGSGPMLDPCQTLARDLGVESRVRWHGAVPGAGSLLGAFDVLAITSWTEGTPMVLLEAMSSGVPVVTTAVGGIPDVVGPGEARLCQPGDVARIASSIDDVRTARDEALAMARAARVRVERDFAVAPWVRRHREIYHSLIEA